MPNSALNAGPSSFSRLLSIFQPWRSWVTEPAFSQQMFTLPKEQADLKTAVVVNIKSVAQVGSSSTAGKQFM